MTDPSASDFATMLIVDPPWGLGPVAAGEMLERALPVLAERLSKSTVRCSGDAIAAVRALIAEIDQALTRQLNLILHHEHFQRVESTWRGLHFLVSNTPSGAGVRIRVIDLSKADLAMAVRGEPGKLAPLHRRIYEDEYDVIGGQPYGCLLGDYSFGHSPQDVELLGQIAALAAITHGVFMAAAAPSLLGLSSWRQLDSVPDIAKVTQAADYAPWNAFRESSEASHIVLTMPHFLARIPYGAKTNPVEEFAFEEDEGTDNNDDLPWCNSAYARAVTITRCVAETGWFAQIVGLEGGGALSDLPVSVRQTPEGAGSRSGPMETDISPLLERDLVRLGLLPLQQRANIDTAVFGSTSAFRSVPLEQPARAEVRLTADLRRLLAAGRFAQYLEILARWLVFGEAIVAASDLQARLALWCQQYVLTDRAIANETAQAAQPLAAAEVAVEELAGQPGGYAMHFSLAPQYQLKEPVALHFAVRLACN